METIGWVFGVLLALSVGLFCYAALGAIVSWSRLLWRRASLSRNRLYRAGFIRDPREEKKAMTEDDILGLAHIPWMALYLVAAVIALAVMAISGNWLFLALPGLVFLARGYLVRQKRRFLNSQIRQLLIDARMRMSLFGSLLLGLENIAATTVETSVVYETLKRQFKGGLPKSGQEVLQQMAAELKAPLLVQTVQRVKAAQQAGGVVDLDRALADSIEEATQHINTYAEEQIQRMPLRITMLATPFLLIPIIILLFWPLADRIIKTLSGLPVGGGF